MSVQDQHCNWQIMLSEQSVSISQLANAIKKDHQQTNINNQNFANRFWNRNLEICLLFCINYQR